MPNRRTPENLTPQRRKKLLSALDNAQDYEVCIDLARKFGGKVKGNERRGALIFYLSEAARALRFALARRSLILGARERQGRFPKLESILARHLFSKLNGNSRRFARDVLDPLARAWLADSAVLRDFLAACFQRWAKIDHPQSKHRREFVIRQLALKDGNFLRDHLEKIGVFAPATTAEESERQDAQIRQALSRTA